MSEDIYVFEAILLKPAITEAEIEVRIRAGEYQKVTWEDDGRIGDGYFVKVGEHGMIGIAMSPVLDENGKHRHRGIAVEANPLEEDHRDSTIEVELRKIVDDFGSTPDGTPRRFERAVYIEKGDVEFKVFVSGSEIVREQVEPAKPTTTQSESS
ncbi:hypothetical protein [Glycomyces harbinensis]|uniref:Uncharacterized protein n=1 Tax=Glycomyces harbinensis TaxID=58114 RepID=A0A1G7DVH4_9ACTN|nr:hypothetical protein [Glycomyces harbinensis]SDE55443.1 hypothetical protein SAMN05216270_12915 [Glycomyces harbinensis]